MDYEKLIKLFKMLAPDMADKKEDDIKAWLDLAAPHVSKCRFGALYEQALVYYAAYLAELAKGIEEDGDGGAGSSTTQGPVTSIKEGDLAISYGSGGSSSSDGNANASVLSKNIYGQQFLAISQKVGGGTPMTRFTRMC